MGNQVLLWAIIIVPWATIIFMNKRDIKRFIGSAFFAAFMCIIVIDSGITIDWWAVKETAYPLRNAAFVFGLNPAMTMWILKFTFGRFWLFLIVDLLSNLFFSYIFLARFLQPTGAVEYLKVSPLYVFIEASVIGGIIYGYQKWQEDIFAERYRRN